MKYKLVSIFGEKDFEFGVGVFGSWIFMLFIFLVKEFEWILLDDFEIYLIIL